MTGPLAALLAPTPASGPCPTISPTSASSRSAACMRLTWLLGLAGWGPVLPVHPAVRPAPGLSGRTARRGYTAPAGCGPAALLRLGCRSALHRSQQPGSQRHDLPDDGTAGGGGLPAPLRPGRRTQGRGTVEVRPPTSSRIPRAGVDGGPRRHPRLYTISNVRANGVEVPSR